MPYPAFFLVMCGVFTLLMLALVVGVSWLTTAVQRLFIRSGLLCPHARIAPCQACLLDQVRTRLGYVPLDVQRGLRELD